MTTKFQSKAWISSAIAAWIAACADASVSEQDAASSPVPTNLTLIDHSQWHEFPAEQDPLSSHQPASVDCGPAGWYIEPALDRALLEIDTNFCNYALLEHPALHAIARGDVVRFELRHYDLRAPEPTQAHVAWLFGDRVEWETTVPIPSDAAVQSFEWRARRALAAGAPIRFHLHNHGQNTWLIAELTVTPQRGAPRADTPAPLR
ncbi:MAG TPA: hypothetical protein VJR89_21175 [Polyangiales bacterium]|nr:hypothetical protein [Polyangiales bacterium]